MERLGKQDGNNVAGIEFLSVRVCFSNGIEWKSNNATATSQQQQRRQMQGKKLSEALTSI